MSTAEGVKDNPHKIIGVMFTADCSAEPCQFIQFSKQQDKWQQEYLQMYIPPSDEDEEDDDANP